MTMGLFSPLKSALSRIQDTPSKRATYPSTPVRRSRSQQYPPTQPLLDSGEWDTDNSPSPLRPLKLRKTPRSRSAQPQPRIPQQSQPQLHPPHSTVPTLPQLLQTPQPQPPRSSRPPPPQQLQLQPPQPSSTLSPSPLSPQPTTPRLRRRNTPITPLAPPTPPPPPCPLAPAFSAIHTALSHTHYGLIGRAALVAHGFPTTTLPAHITILIPSHSRPIITAWARSAGWEKSRTHPDELVVSVPSGSGNGTTDTYVVRMKGVDDEVFHGMETVLVEGAQVVDLVGLVDQFARSWRVTKNEEVAFMVVWLLEKLVSRGSRVEMWRCPNVVRIGEEFGNRYSKAKEMIRILGLSVDGDGWF